MRNEKDIADLIESSKLTCWQLSFKEDRWDRSFKPAFNYMPRKAKADTLDTAGSIEMLNNQLRIYAKNPEAEFQITLKDIASSTANNNDVVGPLIFKVSPAEAAQPSIQGVQPVIQQQAPGFETYQAWHLAMMELQDKRTEFAVERANFNAEKQRFEDEKRRTNEELERLKVEYESDVERAKKGAGKAFKSFLDTLLGDDEKKEGQLSGAEATKEEQTTEEKALDSIFDLCMDSFKSMEEIQQLGILVGRVSKDKEIIPFLIRVRPVQPQNPENDA